MREERDPEHEKKQKNIEKLKRNLAQKLWIHRQLEISQMPFDSSKVEFHDKKDMFSKMEELKRPATQNNKRKQKKSEDASAKNEINSQMNEYIQAIEQRKKE